MNTPPPLKVGFFNEPLKYYSFLSLTPSYVLKGTKFLLKMSQFEFSVMTEKNIFAYKLFLSLNISDLNLFFMWKLHPIHFPSNSLLNVEVFSSPLFSKIWLEAHLPLQKAEGGGAHITRHNSSTFFLAETFYIFRKSSVSKYKFGEISPEKLKVWNFTLWWAPFVKIK